MLMEIPHLYDWNNIDIQSLDIEILLQMVYDEYRHAKNYQIINF